MKKLLAILLVAVCNQVALAQFPRQFELIERIKAEQKIISESTVIASDFDEKSSGSTRVKGSYSLLKRNDEVRLKIGFDVRKSGSSGTGKGSMAVQILDGNWNPIYSYEKGFSVGAKPLEGTNSKSDSPLILLPQEKATEILQNGTYIAFEILQSDSTGIPKLPGGWQRILPASVRNRVSSSPVGNLESHGNWRIKRIK